jgi:hypothetical protein
LQLAGAPLPVKDNIFLSAAGDDRGEISLWRRILQLAKWLGANALSRPPASGFRD